jgi:anti-sigma regulatory factor (Ser/Thr protein kinase)
MITFRKRYTSLTEAINDLRGVLQRSSTPDVLADVTLPDDVLEYTRLVAHEWLVNLVQHATFKQTPPMIDVQLHFTRRHVSCEIKDNSDGFDMERQLEAQEEAPPPLPEGGMGLRIIRACTREMSYTTDADGLQHFSCIIPSDSQPWVNIPF